MRQGLLLKFSMLSTQKHPETPTIGQLHTRRSEQVLLLSTWGPEGKLQLSHKQAVWHLCDFFISYFSPLPAWGRSPPWAGDCCDQGGLVFDPVAVTTDDKGGTTLSSKPGSELTESKNLTSSQKRHSCDVCLGNTSEKDGWNGSTA